MALSDLILKAKVNMAIARDPHVSTLEIHVDVEDGVVILKGDVDSQEKCHAAEQAARHVEGMKDVRNEMTCGIEKRATTAIEVVERFLEKLDAKWHQLPDQSALTQADYVRWALWMVYKFHIPEHFAGEDPAKLEVAAIERALEQIGMHLNVPKVLLALEMLRQAEMVALLPGAHAPETANPDLIATPLVETNATPARAADHTPRV